jgi:uncharacterized protein with FMN-binding domain
MTRRIEMPRPVPAVLSTLAAVGATAPAAAAIVAPAPTATTAAAAKVYHGSAASMRWGVVQVTITVSGRRITAVSDSLPEHKPRSLFLNKRAEPILKRETLAAQSARISLVSGATLTSRAWAQSLQYALTKAHL